MSKIILNIAVKQNFWPAEIKPEHYVLGNGKIKPKIRFKDGHGWGDFIPVGETQSKNGIDPQSCPAGGTLNCVEAIGRFEYGKSFQSDLAERFLAILMGMKGFGGNPHVAGETWRKFGAVPEVFLPFDDSIDTIKKYFSPNPMSYWLFKVGQSWLKKYDLKHQWLFYGDEPLKDKQARIKEALKSSPVGVSGYAWSLHDDGKHYKDGPDIHWFTVYDFVEGDYWLAYDTYPDANGSYSKKLDWNYNFGYAKGYDLTRKLGAESIEETIDDAEEVRLQYALYLAKWFISKFANHEK